MRISILIMAVAVLSGCEERKSIMPSLDLCSLQPFEVYADSLLQDTLLDQNNVVKDDWYKVKVNELLEAIKANCEDAEHKVYPFELFDQVTYYSMGFEFFGKNLDEEETKILLELMNNPLHYGWGETTPEIDQIIVFKNKGREIARLEVMDVGVIITRPRNVFMKAGAVNKAVIEALKKF